MRASVHRSPSTTGPNPWWQAVNYVARLLVALMGLLLLVVPLPLSPGSLVFARTFGAVMALFGLYRLVWYYWRTRQRGDDTAL